MLIEQNAAGIGDVILGACAVKGFKAENPKEHIEYACYHHDWISLWDGYDKLEPSLFNRPNPKARQLNRNYDKEVSSQFALHRVLRYCQNIGVKKPLALKLKQPGAVLSYANEFKDFISLCPFSAYNNRSYPLENWLELERMLLDAGHDVVVLSNKQDKIKDFKSKKLWDKDPAFITSVLFNSKLVIGVDTGLCHVSNQLMKKTIVLGGPSKPDKIFFHPVFTLVSDEKCQGCSWQKLTNGVKGYDSRCDNVCTALKKIHPLKVFNLAVQILSS